MIRVTRLDWEISNTHKLFKNGDFSAVLTCCLMPSNIIEIQNLRSEK